MRAAEIWPAASLGLAVCASGLFLLIPLDSNGETVRGVNEPRLFLRALSPVIIALLALLIPRRVMRVVAAMLRLGFSVATIMSVGMFYLPAAAAMLVAACLPAKRQTS